MNLVLLILFLSHLGLAAFLEMQEKKDINQGKSHAISRHLAQTPDEMQAKSDLQISFSYHRSFKYSQGNDFYRPEMVNRKYKDIFNRPEHKTTQRILALQSFRENIRELGIRKAYKHKPQFVSNQPTLDKIDSPNSHIPGVSTNLNYSLYKKYPDIHSKPSDLDIILKTSSKQNATSPQTQNTSLTNDRPLPLSYSKSHFIERFFRPRSPRFSSVSLPFKDTALKDTTSFSEEKLVTNFMELFSENQRIHKTNRMRRNVATHNPSTNMKRPGQPKRFQRMGSHKAQKDQGLQVRRNNVSLSTATDFMRSDESVNKMGEIKLYTQNSGKIHGSPDSGDKASTSTLLLLDISNKSYSPPEDPKDADEYEAGDTFVSARNDSLGESKIDRQPHDRTGASKSTYGFQATVQELPMAVQELHQHQVQDRRRLQNLEQRFRSKIKDLQDAYAVISETKQSQKNMQLTVNDLEIKMQELRKETETLKKKQQRYMSPPYDKDEINKSPARKLDKLSRAWNRKIKTLKQKSDSDINMAISNINALRQKTKQIKEDYKSLKADFGNLKTEMENIVRKETVQANITNLIETKVKDAISTVHELENNVSEIRTLLGAYKDGQVVLEEQIDDLQAAVYLYMEPDDGSQSHRTDPATTGTGNNRKIRKSRHLSKLSDTRQINKDNDINNGSDNNNENEIVDTSKNEDSSMVYAGLDSRKESTDQVAVIGSYFPSRFISTTLTSFPKEITRFIESIKSYISLEERKFSKTNEEHLPLHTSQTSSILSEPVRRSDSYVKDVNHSHDITSDERNFAYPTSDAPMPSINVKLRTKSTSDPPPPSFYVKLPSKSTSDVPFIKSTSAELLSLINKTTTLSISTVEPSYATSTFPLPSTSVPATPALNQSTFYEVSSSPLLDQSTFYEVSSSPLLDQSTFNEVSSSPLLDQSTFYEVSSSPLLDQSTFYEVSSSSPLLDQSTFYEVSSSSPLLDQSTFYEVSSSSPLLDQSTFYEVSSSSPLLDQSTFYEVSSSSPLLDQSTFYEVSSSPFINEGFIFVTSPYVQTVDSPDTLSHGRLTPTPVTESLIQNSWQQTRNEEIRISSPWQQSHNEQTSLPSPWEQSHNKETSSQMIVTVNKKSDKFARRISSDSLPADKTSTYLSSLLGTDTAQVLHSSPTSNMNVLHSLETTDGNVLHSSQMTDGNGLHSSQMTDGNGLHSSQMADGNILHSSQMTDGNILHSSQMTDGNGLHSSQMADGNILHSSQMTDGNILHSSQMTDGNILHSSQMTDGNILHSSQMTDGNILHSSQMTDGNDLHSSQMGDRNVLHLSQMGDGNGLHLSQMGDGNVLHLSQMGDGNGLHLSQMGDRNVLHLSQMADGNGLHSSQMGDGNGLHQSQMADGNGLHSSQMGDGNGLHSSQMGDGNGLHQSQMADGNGLHSSQMLDTGFLHATSDRDFWPSLVSTTYLTIVSSKLDIDKPLTDTPSVTTRYASDAVPDADNLLSTHTNNLSLSRSTVYGHTVIFSPAAILTDNLIETEPHARTGSDNIMTQIESHKIQTGTPSSDVKQNTSINENGKDHPLPSPEDTYIINKQSLGYIQKLENRINNLEMSVIQMTKASKLQNEEDIFARNKSSNLPQELHHHNSSIQRQINDLRKMLHTERNQTRSFWEEFQNKSADIKHVQALASHTFLMVTHLAAQVSTINMDEFISKLHQSLHNFAQNVMTREQWSLASDEIMNATLDNKEKVSQIRERTQESLHSMSKLHERVSSVHNTVQLWYKSLQGHMIRLNNTVQDLRERVDEMSEIHANRGQFLQTDNNDMPNRSNLEARLDSLNIQLLHNANRLSMLETTLLNQSLIQCRRSSAEAEQESKILSLSEKHDKTRQDIILLTDKVNRVDLNVFRVQSSVKATDKIIGSLRTNITELLSIVPQIAHLQKETDNATILLPQDCQDYFHCGFQESGVYIINPRNLGRTVRVYCIMEGKTSHNTKCNCSCCSRKVTNIIMYNESTGNEDSRSTGEYSKPEKEATSKIDSDTTHDDMKDYTGGWTVLQHRQNGKVSFTRSWSDYAEGFGDVAGEYWVGNDIINLLTKEKDYELRIKMEDIFSTTWEVRYDQFKVGERKDGYRIQIGGYHGNASDGMVYSNMAAFSAVDTDNDASSSHCAMYNGGGWWYRHCHVSNLNGPYDVGMVWFNRAWQDWLQIKSSIMMIRPRPV